MRESLSDKVKKAARGNWPLVLLTLGVPAAALDGRNCPCPGCGGKDRFQFTVRGAGAEYGRFACRHMDSQGGDGFALVRHIFDLNFPEAVRAVANVLGIDVRHDDVVVERVAKTVNGLVAKPEVADNTKKVQRVFDLCATLRPNNITGLYLQKRGIAASYWPEPHTSPLRHCEALDYWHTVDNKPVKLGAFPALVARIDKPDGAALAGIHRIYLSDKAEKRVIRVATGSPDRPHIKILDNKKLQAAHEGAIKGAACRLYPVGNDGRLALTEGIETALAVRCLTGLAVWACISAGGLKSVVLPDEVREVLIYADNDPPDERGRNIGKEAAYLLAARMIEEGRKVKVLLAPQVGTDWLDYLNDEMN
ncbi:toprim domain-containing protein [Deefgea piscis]|uniref:toprim domain-containing protein n=1 Tax=Deefgea piscis TaxID=2739061 RepID=UPI001C7F1325|nr:toprim domain-containing protein [Deefgea piscis]QZA82558.1 toprim domain-containing protein [Deefgea piscis]